MSEQQSTTPAATAQETILPGTELLPVEPSEILSYEQADKTDQKSIDELINELDLSDTNSILFFGSKAQEQLTMVSDNMLEGVRNKDLGAAGLALNNMVTALKGFDLSTLKEKPGFFARLFGKAKPIVQFINQYEESRLHIDRITDDMEQHKTQLLIDITSLDRLYKTSLDYLHSLDLYIAAGEERINRLDNQELPALVAEAKNSDDVLVSQQLRDKRVQRDELERRVHDLKLTRQVAMQGLPSIRMVQENDKGLVNKISSTLVNTVPLWRQQLAQAVTIYRSQQAAETVKAASDLTNELLEKNAANLKTANAEIRQQLERGVFDIESIEKAHRSLIATIEETLQITEQGKQRRSEAETKLLTMESELRTTLATAKARASSNGASTSGHSDNQGA
ncbi:MAG: toxic anion resistance protein [Gammaproteobacteria bacterium]|nr:toxic anion resistance protein [Gammaproteobacteria bacterium]